MRPFTKLPKRPDNPNKVINNLIILAKNYINYEVFDHKYIFSHNETCIIGRQNHDYMEFKDPFGNTL